MDSGLASLQKFPCETCTKLTSTACPSCNVSFCSLDCGDSLERHSEDCGVQISIHIRDTFAQIFQKFFSSLARVALSKFKLPSMMTTKPIKDCERAYNDYADSLGTMLKKINRSLVGELKAGSGGDFRTFEQSILGFGGNVLRQVEMSAYGTYSEADFLVAMGDTLWSFFGTEAKDWKDAVNAVNLFIQLGASAETTLGRVANAGAAAGKQFDNRISNLRDEKKREKREKR